jgi:DUF218 domain
MNQRNTSKRAWPSVLAIGAGVLVLLASKAADFLVIDEPHPSDLILVLAGETEKRPERALLLLTQGYGRKIVVDVPEDGQIYGFTEIDLAQRYFRSLPQEKDISVCPIAGLSTKEETKDVGKCLAGTGAKSILIVTADFHTRRALDIFRHELPQYGYSTAAARNSQAFGSRWWTHRQWAKTLFDEWLRLAWWKCVDRWL